MSTEDGVKRPRGRYWHPLLGVFLLGWLAVLCLAFPAPGQLALRHGPLILVGLRGATIGNATAVGGGIVFVPAMMLLYDLDPVASLKLALVVQAFGMSSGAIAWLRRGAVGLGSPARNAWITIASVGGALFGALALAPSPATVKGLFGPVSIGIGLVVLLMLRRRGERETPPTSHLWAIAVAALVGGVLTAWVAIGVGEVLAAVLILLSGLLPARAVGFGVVQLAACSVALALVHALVLGGVLWELAVFLIPGAVLGGRLGPIVAAAAGPRRLKLGFACVAIAHGCLFVWQSVAAGA